MEQRATEGTDAATLATLERLNAEYERAFGFRFVVFVRGRSRAEIVPVLRARLSRTPDEELASGLEESSRSRATGWRAARARAPRSGPSGR